MAIGSHIKAVGFDMDGTFMNTHVDYPRLRNVLNDVMKEEGIPVGESVWSKEGVLISVPLHDWIRNAGRQKDEDRIIREINNRSTAIEKMYYRDSSPFPLAVETLVALKQKEYKVGILTRGGRDYAESVLGLWNLYDGFHTVVCRDDYAFEDAKPSPMSIKHFARELDVQPEEVLYLGDNLSDWYAARDAGADFIGVLSGGCNTDDWKEAGVSTVIDGVGDLLDMI
jgi:phosphoglycolate phosphatase